MRAILELKWSGQDVPVRNQKEVNSFVHKLLGKDNRWHDAFSDYSVSSLQGGKLDRTTGMLSFPDGKASLIIGSRDPEFVSTVFMNAMTKGLTLFGMDVETVYPVGIRMNREYDRVLTVSPILLKKDGVKVTVDDLGPEGFVKELETHCVKKLAHDGISTDGFKLELLNPDRAKKKLVWVGDVFNPCSMVGMLVYGSREARERLYEIGFGNSCGSGFGCVSVNL